MSEIEPISDLRVAQSEPVHQTQGFLPKESLEITFQRIGECPHYQTLPGNFRARRSALVSIE